MTAQFTEDHFANHSCAGLAYTIADHAVPITGYVFVDLFVRPSGQVLAPWPGARLRFFDLTVAEVHLGQPVVTVAFHPDTDPARAGVQFVSFGESGRLVTDLPPQVLTAGDRVPELVTDLAVTLAERLFTDRRVAEVHYQLAVEHADQALRDHSEAELCESQLGVVRRRAWIARDNALALKKYVENSDPS